MQLAPGARLGPYEILSFIGRGGMGEVWQARDGRLDREVAIKALPSALSANAEHLARFRREARAASALNHPNICTVYDLGNHEGQPFIVMELLTGTTLAGLLSAGPLALDRAVDLGLQLADALDAAHGQGIVHRDLKPANIFVTDRGLAKILDFGLARVQAAVVDGDAPTQDAAFATQAGLVAGTVAYMSPEQARGEPLDARTDLFSLGVVLYEMTTGRQAFPGHTTAVVFNRILGGVFDLPSRVNAALPRELDRLLDSLLATDRDHRCPSARELRAGLEKLGRVASGSRASRASQEADGGKASIVVLPFQNLSADPDNEYFSDGLTDEIISDLSQIRTLRVISRNSSMQLKGAAKDVKTIAGELGVRYVLSGGVRKSRSAVRITAQLVDPVTDESLWSEKYSGTDEEIFDIQEQISRRIVDALKMRLSPDEDRRIAERPVDNVEAHQCYQRSRQEVYKFTKDGLDQALALIDTALGLVGDNELLYAATGTVHWQYINAAISADLDHIVQAERCAGQVFALNSDSAPGHALMGMVRQAQGRPAEAIASLRQALEIDPTNDYAVSELTRLYFCVGRDDDGRMQMQRMLSADPLSAIMHGARLWSGLLAGDHDFVQREGPRLLRSMQGSPLVRLHLLNCYALHGRLDEAHEVADAMPPETAPTIGGRLCTFWKLALEGRHEDAAACVDEHLLSCAWNVEFWAKEVAECYGFIDDRTRALDWLERAARQGFLHYPYFSSRSPLWRRFDADPRFQALMRDVKASWEQLQAV